MAGAWIIEDEHKTGICQIEVWSNKLMQNTVIAVEALIILDLVTIVVQKIGKKGRRIVEGAQGFQSSAWVVNNRKVKVDSICIGLRINKK